MASLMASRRVRLPLATADDLAAQRLHLEDVELLPADVFLAHVDLALQAEEGGGGGRGDAVLAGPGLGDDARLAHALRQQGLADAVVDLVGAGVVQVLALEEDAGAAGLLRQPLGEVQRRRPADVMVQVIRRIAGWNSGSSRACSYCSRELAQGVHQRFGTRTAAVGAEPTVHIGNGAKGIRHEELPQRCRSQRSN